MAVYFYETVTDAINLLRGKGYTMDFNLHENCIICNDQKFYTDDFHVDEVYRYEGNTDPADEATVFGISSKAGLKGILVIGNESSLDSFTTDIVRKLYAHKQ